MLKTAELHLRKEDEPEVPLVASKEDFEEVDDHMIPEELLVELSHIAQPKEGKKNYKNEMGDSLQNVRGGPPANLWHHRKRRNHFRHLTDYPKSRGNGVGTRDISFIYDLKLRAKSPSSPVPVPPPLAQKSRSENGIASKLTDSRQGSNLSSLHVAERLVEEEYHLVRAKAVDGLQMHDERDTTRLYEHNSNKQRAFPSLQPAKRHEVVQMLKTFDYLMERSGVGDESGELTGPSQIHHLLELVKKEQKIYDLTFSEVIRQVSVGCLERGQLLSKLRNKYADLLGRIPRQVKSLHTEVLAQRALDRRLTEELSRFKSSIFYLTKELKDMKQKDEQVSADVFKVEQELSQALEESHTNANMVEEYHSLYELQRKRLENIINELTAEKEMWLKSALTLSKKVIDDNSLKVSKKLNVVEKSWAKMADHFTLLLQDSDSQSLADVQKSMASWRQAMFDFNQELEASDRTTEEFCSKVTDDVSSWKLTFNESVIDVTDEGYKRGKIDAEQMRALKETFTRWEKDLGTNMERYTNDSVLEGTNNLQDMREWVDNTSESAFHVFRRHKSKKGDIHHYGEKMQTVMEKIGTLEKQLEYRVNGDNGVVAELRAMEKKVKAMSSRLQILEAQDLVLSSDELLKLDEQFNDYAVQADRIKSALKRQQSVFDHRHDVPYKKLEPSEVMNDVSDWVRTSVHGIEAVNGQLQNKASSIHSRMTHWMVQSLIHLAPDYDASQVSFNATSSNAGSRLGVVTDAGAASATSLGSAKTKDADLVGSKEAEVVENDKDASTSPRRARFHVGRSSTLKSVPLTADLQINATIAGVGSGSTGTGAVEVPLSTEGTDSARVSTEVAEAGTEILTSTAETGVEVSTKIDATQAGFTTDAAGTGTEVSFKTAGTEVGVDTKTAGTGVRVVTKTAAAGVEIATKTAGAGVGTATKTAGAGVGTTTKTAGAGVGTATKTAGAGVGIATKTAGAGVGAATKTAGAGVEIATKTAGAGIGTTTKTAGAGVGTATKTAGAGVGTATKTAGAGVGIATKTAGAGVGTATKIADAGATINTAETATGSGVASKTAAINAGAYMKIAEVKDLTSTKTAASGVGMKPAKTGVRFAPDTVGGRAGASSTARAAPSANMTADADKRALASTGRIDSFSINVPWDELLDSAKDIVKDMSEFTSYVSDCVIDIVDSKRFEARQMGLEENEWIEFNNFKAEARDWIETAEHVLTTINRAKVKLTNKKIEKKLNFPAAKKQPASKQKRTSLRKKRKQKKKEEELKQLKKEISVDWDSLKERMDGMAVQLNQIDGDFGEFQIEQVTKGPVQTDQVNERVVSETDKDEEKSEEDDEDESDYSDEDEDEIDEYYEERVRDAKAETLTTKYGKEKAPEPKLNRERTIPKVKVIPQVEEFRTEEPLSPRFVGGGAEESDGAVASPGKKANDVVVDVRNRRKSVKRSELEEYDQGRSVDLMFDDFEEKMQEQQDERRRMDEHQAEKERVEQLQRKEQRELEISDHERQIEEHQKSKPHKHHHKKHNKRHAQQKEQQPDEHQHEDASQQQQQANAMAVEQEQQQQSKRKVLEVERGEVRSVRQQKPTILTRYQQEDKVVSVVEANMLKEILDSKLPESQKLGGILKRSIERSSFDEQRELLELSKRKESKAATTNYLDDYQFTTRPQLVFTEELQTGIPNDTAATQDRTSMAVTVGGSSNVATIGGTSNVATIGGSPNVGTIGGSSNVGTVGGSPNVGTIGGSSNVGTVGGSPNVGTIGGSSNVGTVGGSPNFGTIGRSSNVATIDRTSTVATADRTSTVAHLEPATATMTLQVCDVGVQFNTEDMRVDTAVGEDFPTAGRLTGGVPQGAGPIVLPSQEEKIAARRALKGSRERQAGRVSFAEAARLDIDDEILFANDNAGKKAGDLSNDEEEEGDELSMVRMSQLVEQHRRRKTRASSVPASLLVAPSTTQQQQRRASYLAKRRRRSRSHSAQLQDAGTSALKFPPADPNSVVPIRHSIQLGPHIGEDELEDDQVLKVVQSDGVIGVRRENQPRLKHKEMKRLGTIGADLEEDQEKQEPQLLQEILSGDMDARSRFRRLDSLAKAEVVSDLLRKVEVPIFTESGGDATKSKTDFAAGLGLPSFDVRNLGSIDIETIGEDQCVVNQALVDVTFKKLVPPATSLTHDAFAAINKFEKLQTELIETEKRAQSAETRLICLEEENLSAREKIRQLEKTIREMQKADNARSLDDVAVEKSPSVVGAPATSLLNAARSSNAMMTPKPSGVASSTDDSSMKGRKVTTPVKRKPASSGGKRTAKKSASSPKK